MTYDIWLKQKLGTFKDSTWHTQRHKHVAIMHLNSWIWGSKTKHQKTCYPTTFRSKRVTKPKPKLLQHNLKTLFFVFSAALTFAHSFDHNSHHRTPNALIIFLLETRLTELSFDIKNVIFGSLSRCSLIF